MPYVVAYVVAYVMLVRVLMSAFAGCRHVSARAMRASISHSLAHSSSVRSLGYLK
jgi:hypothetical protein